MSGKRTEQSSLKTGGNAVNRTDGMDENTAIGVRQNAHPYGYAVANRTYQNPVVPSAKSMFYLA